MFTCPDGYIVGDTIYFPFDTYDSNGASVTITGLAVTDIEAYKNGSVTQRASDNGYALLDTDGIDFDGATGVHGFSIDTSDNSDAGFWVDGTYFITVNAITVDSQTVRLTYWLKLGPVKANVTHFGGTAGTFSGGRPEVNASHWAGAETATNDVALATAPTNFASFAITAAGGVTLADGVTHGGSTADFEARDMSVAGITNFVGAFVADNAGNQIKGIDSFTTAGKAELQQEATDALNAYDPPTKAEMDAGLDALPTAAENADAVWDEDATAHQTQGTFGQAIGDPGADSDSIWALANTNLNATVSSRASQVSVDDIPTNSELTTALANLDAAVSTRATPAQVNTEADTALVDAGLSPMHTGTAQAGASGSITLASGASSSNDYYKNAVVRIVSGTGLGQAREISGYTGSTRVATVTRNWTTNPDATSVYAVLPLDSATQLTYALASGASGFVVLAGALSVALTNIATVDGVVDAILLDTGTDGVVVAAGSKTGYTLASSHDIYHVDISLCIDEANAKDEYTVTWFKNGVRQTSGITSPTIQVIKRADGTDLIASTAMTQIGSTGSYKYDATTTARTTAGEAVVVVIGATIDSAARSFAKVLTRDSTA